MDNDIEYTIVQDFQTPFSGQIENVILKNWGYNYAYNGFKYRSVEEYKLWKQDNIFLIATLNEELLGFVVYEKYSMFNNTTFTPCLSCLYVADDWRNKGIGAAIMDKMCAYVRTQLGEPRLYLWLPKEALREWFGGLGWKYLTRRIYLDQEVSIMYRNLSD